MGDSARTRTDRRDDCPEELPVRALHIRQYRYRWPQRLGRLPQTEPGPVTDYFPVLIGASTVRNGIGNTLPSAVIVFIFPVDVCDAEIGITKRLF